VIRPKWGLVLIAIIAAGIGSRMLHSGWLLLDKYLGDALYAAMIYAFLSLVWNVDQTRRAISAMILVSALEFFQLTGIPAEMFEHGNALVRLLARLLGTQFSFVDLAAYAAGIAVTALIDRSTS